jgi:hypothetical protein
MAIEDRAALVARAVIELLSAALREGELHRHLAELLRDEIADVQREAVADRDLSDDA